jgi:hypothetical protein
VRGQVAPSEYGWVGIRRVGDKIIMILAEILSKLRFFGIS